MCLNFVAVTSHLLVTVHIGLHTSNTVQEQQSGPGNWYAGHERLLTVEELVRAAGLHNKRHYVASSRGGDAATSRLEMRTLLTRPT